MNREVRGSSTIQNPEMGRKGYVMNVALLQQSFAEVKSQQEAFAEAFYRRLFALYPQTIPLFATTNMKRQQSLLMATLELVVAGVARGDNVIPSVEQLGRRHAIYGVKAEHYSIPYFSCRNPRRRSGTALASSCQVSTLQRIRRSTGRTHFITAYQASISSGLLASVSTQNTQFAV